jgi:hypothetical protein
VQMWKESTHLNSIHAKEFRQKVLYMWELCGKIFFLFFCNFISQPCILFDLGICFFLQFFLQPSVLFDLGIRFFGNFPRNPAFFFDLGY